MEQAILCLHALWI